MTVSSRQNRVWNSAAMSTLVDADGSAISPMIYHDADIYERELECVFGASWLFLAHEDQIPRFGDFITTYMGEDPIIVVRQRDNSIKALLNQCRHRGMKICRADSGRQKAFTCSYHGWVYDTAGALVSVPMEADAYGARLDKAQLGLHAAPRVETHRGLIFATWNKSASTLAEYLGDAAWYMDVMFDRTGVGSEMIGGMHKWVIECNWKLAAEQFATDMYHGPISHISAAIAGLPEDFPLDQLKWPGGAQFRDEKHGHGFGFFDSEDGFNFLRAIVGDVVVNYLVAGEGAERARRHLGDLRAQRTPTGHMTVFPNFSFLPGINTFRVWHPRGPSKMEVWSGVVVDRDAPPEVKEAYRVAVSRTFSPAGVFEQDDGENWVELQSVLRGHQARQSKLHVGMGADNVPRPEYPGALSNIWSEAAGRNFYRTWARLMADAT